MAAQLQLTIAYYYVAVLVGETNCNVADKLA